MNYLLFNNEILISDGQVVKKIDQGDGSIESFGSIEKARVCCVDVDVMIASAPEDYLDKKDNILAQKFQDIYSNDYITLNERIDSNIFQVIGIKSEKLKEIYSLIPSSKVDTFLPYAQALRSLLVQRQVAMSRSIIFVDDLGQEKLITVFDGLKFSRTRTVHTDKTEDILPDIKRSHIDFNKKLGEFASTGLSGDFTVMTNSQQIASGIKLLEPGIAVEFLDCTYPALEGLKYADTPIKYRIHEEIIRERQQKELRIKLMYLMIAFSICFGGAIFFGYNKMAYSSIAYSIENDKLNNLRLKTALNRIDQYIYREYLRKSKSINYSNIFFELSELLPSTYEISSFKFIEQNNHWFLDVYLLTQEGQFDDGVPRTGMLKRAKIESFIIKNSIGKYLRIPL
jgi:hypothetical protein